MTPESGAPRPRASFFQSFRQSHPLLKLALSICIFELACLGVELLSYRYVSYAFGFHRPVFRTRLSGYRVFEESPDYANGVLIEARPGETHTSDANGFYCDHAVTLAKPPGTLRIFVTGGSALAGAGQTPGMGYESVHAYPGGTYVYRASIAGCLGEALRAKSPGLAVEVVSAAYNQKALHQSLAQYLEQLSRFQPDYVVSMDGFNDLAAIAGPEDAWREYERRFLEPMVELDNQSRRSQHATYTGLLASLLAEKHGWGRGRSAGHAEGAGGSGPVAARSEEQLRADYEAARSRYAPATERWLQTVRHYLAVVREDDVRLVLALQPLLARGGGNKKLSTIEKGFDQLLVPRADKVADPGLLLQRFYFDEVLAPELARLCAARGQVFCDLGEALRPLGPDVEVYTDYCHLTPEGNRVVGKALADCVLTDLAAHPRSR